MPYITSVERLARRRVRRRLASALLSDNPRSSVSPTQLFRFGGKANQSSLNR